MTVIHTMPIPLELHIGDSIEIHPVSDHDGTEVIAVIRPDTYAAYAAANSKCNAEAEAEAEFIVRACNSHAALVAALSAVIANPRSVKAWEDAEAVLKLAASTPVGGR
jgi:hypothetical protein